MAAEFNFELVSPERVLMSETQRSLEQLERLRALNIRIAVDDFGTGYSSLAYLKRLPLDVLKIDRSFVRNIDTDEENRAITSAIAAMASSLKLDTVAEGVETDAERAVLIELGVTSLQGWLYARAMPPAECEAWLTKAQTSVA